MGTRFEAVMADGALRPVEPVNLHEGQRVRCEISSASGENSFDDRSLDVMEVSNVIVREYLAHLLHSIFHSLTGAQGALSMARHECREYRHLFQYIDEASKHIDMAYTTGKSALGPRRVVRERLRLLQDVIAPAVSRLDGPIRRRSLPAIRVDSESLMRLPPIYADQSGLSQIVIILMLRAITSVSDDSSIHSINVDAEATPESFLIRFRDWGKGVSDFIGEASQDLHDRSSDIPDYYSGIGLLVAAEIARAHGGRLQLSRHHSPTEFTLTLPVSLVKGVENG